jgi:hypothetical protein
MSRKDKSATPADTREDENTQAVASAATDENLDSSQEAEEPEQSMLDAIEESVGEVTEDETIGGGEGDAEQDEPGDDDAPETDADSEGAEGKAAKDDQQESDDKDDNGEDLDPTQRVPYDRFRKVVHQKNEFRRERDEYKQGHENFQAIQNFRERNNLSDQDVVQSLRIAAAINNDPAQALEQLRPIVSQLQQLVGETLPEDLQNRVDLGELSEADARELVKTRNENARLQQQQQREAQQRQETEQQTRVQAARQAMATAATQAENDLKAQDPDYAKKAPFVQKQLRLLVMERGPQTAEDAVNLVKEAYANVNAELAALTRRPAVPRGPSSSGQGGSPTSGPREPNSMLEAMQQAVDGT